MKDCVCFIATTVAIFLITGILSLLLLCSFLSSATVNAIASLGTFFVALISALYAIIQYDNHKKEHRINLLGEYNQRYATDKNVQKVITWMLKVAKLDNNGEIVGAHPNRILLIKPSINEKEMFMRFFEEVYLHIKEDNLDKESVFRLFAYYAIKFDGHPEFRLDITDYKNEKELNKIKDEKVKKELSIRWSGFREFAKQMNNEYKKQLNNK